MKSERKGSIASKNRFRGDEEDRGNFLADTHVGEGSGSCETINNDIVQPIIIQHHFCSHGFAHSNHPSIAQHISESPDSEVWYMGINDPEQPRLFMRSLGVGDTVLVLHGGFGAEHSYLLDLALATLHAEQSEVAQRLLERRAVMMVGGG